MVPKLCAAPCPACLRILQPTPCHTSYRLCKWEGARCRRRAAPEVLNDSARSLQPGDVRSAHVVAKLFVARSAARRRAKFSSARGGGRGRGGDLFLGACRRRRRRGGYQLYQLWAALGATGQLSGIWLGLWVSTSGGAAQSVSMFIVLRRLEHDCSSFEVEVENLPEILE